MRPGPHCGFKDLYHDKYLAHPTAPITRGRGENKQSHRNCTAPLTTATRSDSNPSASFVIATYFR